MRVVPYVLLNAEPRIVVPVTRYAGAQGTPTTGPASTETTVYRLELR